MTGLGLIGLIQDLYAFQKDNETFLHTRFGLGEDVLNPYKEMLRALAPPDEYRNQNTSVAKAKQAISDYRKAVGNLRPGRADGVLLRKPAFLENRQDQGYSMPCPISKAAQRKIKRCLQPT